jgi:hypothetical protein
MTSCHQWTNHHPWLLVAALVLLNSAANAFTSIPAPPVIQFGSRTAATLPIVTTLFMGYVRPEDASEEDSSFSIESGSITRVTAGKRSKLTPKIGDLVRFYDLDGGDRRGEELVGKITFLTKLPQTYLAEITQLDNLGDGYFAEYSSTKRMSKKKDRDIANVSPLSASFVRSEQAFKVPYDASMGRVKVKQEQYDLEGWEGPQAVPINDDIVQADGAVYSELKKKLLKDAAIAGLVGSVLVNILKGTEDAIIYLAGAVASIAYLFLLSVKTDTLASPNRKLGSNVSNLRFLMPVIVVVGVALYNQSLGESNPLAGATNPMDRVTPEQFAAAVLGFLTYRIPLFVGQVQEAFKSDTKGGEGAILPGSAGIALQLAKGEVTDSPTATSVDTLIPVLLISGPQSTGRDELVARLLVDDDRFVSPIFVDKLSDGVTFERLAMRNEFLQLDEQERFGLTKDGILKAAEASIRTIQDESSSLRPNKVVVVNASVELANKLSSSLGGARLIGVWIGLGSVQEFEQRIEEQIDQGQLPIGEDETRETVVRGRIKEIVKEIDYGLSSGIFEFTILNKDTETSLRELKEAAGYCFK